MLNYVLGAKLASARDQFNLKNVMDFCQNTEESQAPKITCKDQASNKD